jgi:hypothetical protein
MDKMTWRTVLIQMDTVVLLAHRLFMDKDQDIPVPQASQAQ